METGAEGTNAVADATLWMPPQASTVAEGVDDLYYGIYWICVFFFLLITFAVVYLVAKYRRRDADQLATSQIAHSTKIEILWTGIPTILVLGIFVWGFNVFMDLHVAPVDAMEIKATAQKWSWSFKYSNGDQTPGELFVPEGKPVKLVMNSKDVIHSFYVPAFRVKQDVVPGRYSSVWFEAKANTVAEYWKKYPDAKADFDAMKAAIAKKQPAPEPKASMPMLPQYQVYCTEYCGTSHSAMLATVVVLPQDEYELRMKKTGFGPQDPIARAKKVYDGLCKSCHTLDGNRLVGPSFKGLYGRMEKITGMDPVKVDENYIRESILEPNAKLVEGYAGGMPSFKGQLSDDQIDDLISWMKTLK
ncbi:MAG: cytochrome c oxidase subunit II [Bradymonadia bacterium]